ncbi:MAG: DegT/DnrJ/EryC1/StrS family aminotransferase [Bacteroidetes bacterium]|nr:DegT/DnrJ/EryC1/StrS family aminotransferase [Bacteroidota bacterium]
MQIPFLDLKLQYLSIQKEIIQEFNDVLSNTSYICGKKVKNFEEMFAKSHNVKYCVGTSSGTDSLHLAYWALGIGISSQIDKGYLKKEMEEVIVPVNTYIATSETISMVGAKPVFVDHQEDTFNIDPNAIEEKITPMTRAIVVVHLYGQPADLDPILKIANKYGLFVIEDCSQSHIAEYKGKRVGTFGNVGTFSFYPGKNLGAYGEAGAVITNDENLFQKMLRYRQHGVVEKYNHDIEGHNYRMEELQGAVLGVKIKYLNEWTEGRRRVASKYKELLANISEVKVPEEMTYAKHVYHLFEIRVSNRDKLASHLRARGVETGLHYPKPLHLQNAYKYRGYSEGNFPVAERVSKEILSLPIYSEMTDEQICYVVENIKEFFSSNSYSK